MGAVLVADDDLSDAHRLVSDIRKATGRQPDHRLHFNQMRMRDRLEAARCIGVSDSISLLAVVVRKAGLRPDGLSERNLMYRYALGLLIERLSWLGSRQSPVDVKISHLKGMRSKAFEDYFYAKRRARSRVAWPHLTATVPTVTNEAAEPLLQLADIAASAVAQSFKVPGEALPTILEPILPRFGRGPSGDRLDAYGLKVLPGGRRTYERFPWLEHL